MWNFLGVGGPSGKIMEIPGGGGSNVKPSEMENPGGGGYGYLLEPHNLPITTLIAITIVTNSRD